MKSVNIDIHSITPEELNHYELIDTREPDEIKNCPPLVFCRQIPFSGFPSNMGEFDKTKSYLLFCAKGMRSHIMAEKLVKEGFQALSVNNGIASLNDYLKNLKS